MLGHMGKRATAGSMLLALFLVSCATSTSPSISSSAAASASASASATATPVPTPDGEQVRTGTCCVGFALEPGRYATPYWFDIPLSLEVGTDWRAFRIDKNLSLSFTRGSNDVGSSTSWMTLFAPETNKVEAFLVDLRATPLLIVGGGAPEPIEVAGYAGEQIDAAAQPNPAQAGNEHRMPGTVDIHAMYRLHSLGITDFSWYTESAEARLRFIFVPVGDHTLIFYLEAPPAEFDAYLELVNGVLETVQIEAPA